VVMLYRDEYYNPHSSDVGVAEAIIAKARNGPTGTVRLAFIAEQTRFANLEGR
jgi:replicative DNA helicase